jgi:hypothetical protein
MVDALSESLWHIRPSRFARLTRVTQRGGDYEIRIVRNLAHLRRFDLSVMIAVCNTLGLIVTQINFLLLKFCSKVTGKILMDKIVLDESFIGPLTAEI